jgi:dienelactone hydrolase
MLQDPTLAVADTDGPAAAIVLVLHGGRARSTEPVPRWALSAARMTPFARALEHAGARSGLVVARLRYRQRGWNGGAQSPVADARWALDRLTERFGRLPIGLLGHSMGGRTALHVADHPGVRGVVALAPWIEAYDPVEPVTDRRLLIMHGTGDRMTDPHNSAAFAERARGLATEVTYITVQGDRHAMLRRARLWHGVAVGFTLGVLLPGPPAGTEDTVTANAVRKALSGQPALTV